MAWGAFIVVMVLLLAVQSSGVRTFLGYCLLLALIGVGLLMLQSIDEKRKAKVALARVDQERVTFTDMRMGLDGPSVRLHGRFRNGDPGYTLTRFQLRLRVLDCAAVPSCTTVGEERADVRLQVPPLQEREFEEDIYFSGLGKPRPGRTWDFSLASVSAQ